MYRWTRLATCVTRSPAVGSAAIRRRLMIATLGLVSFGGWRLAEVKAQAVDPDWMCYAREGADCLWQNTHCMNDNEDEEFCDDIFDDCLTVAAMMCGVE